jgi:hypothetical protein
MRLGKLSRYAIGEGDCHGTCRFESGHRRRNLERSTEHFGRLAVVAAVAGSFVPFTADVGGRSKVHLTIQSPNKVSCCYIGKETTTRPYKTLKMKDLDRAI